MSLISDARTIGRALQNFPSVEDCDGADDPASCTVLESSNIPIPRKGKPYSNTCKTPHNPGEVGFRGGGGKAGSKLIIGSINIADRVYAGFEPALPYHKMKVPTVAKTSSYIFVVLESCVTTRVANKNEIVTQIIRIPYNETQPRPTAEKRVTPAAP